MQIGEPTHPSQSSPDSSDTTLHILEIRLYDERARPLPFAPCVVTQPGRKPRPDRASGTARSSAPISHPVDDGQQDAIITLENIQVPTTVNVKWSRPKPDDGPGSPPPKVTDKFEFELDVAVEIQEDSPDRASQLRLKNMGYVRSHKRADNIREFQRHYKARHADIEIDGTMNAATERALTEAHDGCTLVVKD